MINPNGVWPVMLTPFTTKGEIDVEGLAALTEWYIQKGVSGLFAACQSSEIYSLSLEERVQIVNTTIDAAKGRIPVIASGHISDDLYQQEKELTKIAETGADAVILISNHFAAADENDNAWMKNIDVLLSRLDSSIRFGMYECPYPYKRMLTSDTLQHIAETNRFYFLKDTCCDSGIIHSRLSIIKGTNLRLFNANSTTLLQSLRDGANGYSGVMANFHPELYVWLCNNANHQNAERIQQILSLTSLIERQLYPVNAKYYLKTIEHLPIETFCRVQDNTLMSQTFISEIHNIKSICDDFYLRYCK